MNKRRIGSTVLLEFEDREEAIAYAEAARAYKELWMEIVKAELTGLLSPN